MTLPKNDPYITTTEQLAKADQDELGNLQVQWDYLSEKMQELQARLEAYTKVLEAYKTRANAIHQNGSANPYADDAEVAKKLQGLTNLQQRLIVLGLMNERRLKVAEAGHLLHRIGEIGGTWKNVLPRLYTTIRAHPEIFERVSPGEFSIRAGAKVYLPGKGELWEVVFDSDKVSQL